MTKIKINNKRLLISLVNMMFIIILIFFTFFPSNKYTTDWSRTISLLSFLMIGIQLYSLNILGYKFYEFQYIFLVLSYIFFFGRIWLQYFKLDIDIFWVLHKYYNLSIMYNTGIYVIFCIEFLFLGMIVKTHCYNFVNLNIEDIDNISIFYTGITLLIIAVPCRLYTDAYSIFTTSASGSINSIISPTGLVDDLAYLLIPGIICIMEAKSKQKTWIFISVIVYFIIIITKTGDRRYYVAGILALLAYYLLTENKHKKKKYILKIGILIILIAIFLNFLEIIRDIRIGGLVSFSSFIKNYGFNVLKLNNLIWNVLAEFGISFFSVVAVIENVPLYIPFQLGSTFIKSIPSVLPIGNLVGDYFRNASPSTIINEYTGLPVGSTLFGDLFVNFSYYGIFSCFITGIILSKIFNKKKIINNDLKRVLYYSQFYVLINLIRSSFFEIVRPFIWCTIIPIMVYNIYNIKKKSI